MDRPDRRLTAPHGARGEAAGHRLDGPCPTEQPDNRTDNRVYIGCPVSGPQPPGFEWCDNELPWDEPGGDLAEQFCDDLSRLSPPGAHLGMARPGDGVIDASEVGGDVATGQRHIGNDPARQIPFALSKCQPRLTEVGPKHRSNGRD